MDLKELYHLVGFLMWMLHFYLLFVIREKTITKRDRFHYVALAFIGGFLLLLELAFWPIVTIVFLSSNNKEQPEP